LGGSLKAFFVVELSERLPYPQEPWNEAGCAGLQALAEFNFIYFFFPFFFLLLWLELYKISLSKEMPHLS